MNELPMMHVERKEGSEVFRVNGQPLQVDLLSFWQWSSSDLIGNALRGVLAEYIVASAVGCHGGTRTEWEACDLVTADGIKIEVKSGAYVQSWAQKKLSTIQFDIRLTHGWDAKTNKYSSQKERQADIYVFCVLAHKDQQTIDPLNLDQWVFYVMNTKALNAAVGGQKTIALSKLLSLGLSAVGYSDIAKSINEVLADDG